MRTRYSAIFFLAFALLSCGGKSNEPNISSKQAKDRLQYVNKALVERDRELIEAYIERHRLGGVESNGAGLYYKIWGNSSEPLIGNGNIVTLNYRITLLDGTLCYSSDNSKPKEFTVGYGGVETGLEMAMLLMRKGQSAKLILPPHLAHGLLGDNNLIPPRSIIVYDVHVINVVVK
jgi:FKBP-type peptidyl-prolyl cis-trans isomerase FkpA